MNKHLIAFRIDAAKKKALDAMPPASTVIAVTS